MKSYKIENIAQDGNTCSVAIFRMWENTRKLRDCITPHAKIKSWRTINIPKKLAETLKAGDSVTVIETKFDPSDDWAYVCHKGIAFNYKPVGRNKIAYKSYLDWVPGLFKHQELDRAVFKIALMRECVRRGLMPSLVAWRNLRKVLLSEDVDKSTAR